MITGLPGFQSARDHTPREVLLSDVGAIFLPSNKIIDGSECRDPDNTGSIDHCRKGLVLGLNATSGYYQSSIIGTVATAYVSGVDTTTLKLNTQCATEISRRWASGTQNFYIVANQNDDNAQEEQPPPAELVTYSAVNTSTGFVTVTALDFSYPVGSLIIDKDCLHYVNYSLGLVQMTPQYILCDDYKCTDEDGTSIDGYLARPLVSGMVNTASIINYPTEPKTQRWFKKQLRDGKIGLTFSDDA
jgi:hypothetical protein